MSLSVFIVAIAAGDRADRLAASLSDGVGLPPGSQLEVLRGGPVPARRLDALRRASHDNVALLEDTSVPCMGWAQAACERLGGEPGLLALSGPVHGEGLSPREWGWAALDYGPYLDAPAGDVFTLPGNLLVLRRDAALEACSGEDGLREDRFFPALSQIGRLALDPRLAIALRSAPAGPLLAGQLAHGRGWAHREGGRARWGAFDRVSRLTLWPAVALLKTRRARRSLPPAAPLGSTLCLGACAAAWALGEGLGAVLGGPADEEFWT